VLLVTVMVCVWLTLLLPASAALLQVRLMRYVALLDVTLRMDCRHTKTHGDVREKHAMLESSHSLYHRQLLRSTTLQWRCNV
jgi:hypothetical protein